MPDILPIGQQIKRYRLVNNIRQEDMAETLDISRATLINYEKGHTEISLGFLDRLKKLYPDFQAEKTNVKPMIVRDNFIDFKVLLNVLLSSKNLILIITVFFGITGAGLSFLVDDLYLARISLYPTKENSTANLGQFQSLANTIGMNVPSNNQNFSINDVVKSNYIYRKILNEKWTILAGKKMSLYEIWGLDKLGVSLFSKKSNTIVDSAKIKEKAFSKLAKCIDVSENRKTGLIEIYLELKDSKLAADIANFIGQQTQLYIQRENSAQANKEKTFIEDRLSIVQNELEKFEEELKDYVQSNRGYRDSPELNMYYSRIYRAVESKKQVVLTLQQQLELARIEEVKRSPILHILDKAEPPATRNSPNRITFLIVSMFLGFFLSVAIVVMKY